MYIPDKVAKTFVNRLPQRLVSVLTDGALSTRLLATARLDIHKYAERSDAAVE